MEYFNMQNICYLTSPHLLTSWLAITKWLPPTFWGFRPFFVNLWDQPIKWRSLPAPYCLLPVFCHWAPTSNHWKGNTFWTAFLPFLSLDFVVGVQLLQFLYNRTNSQCHPPRSKAVEIWTWYICPKKTSVHACVPQIILRENLRKLCYLVSTRQNKVTCMYSEKALQVGFHCFSSLNWMLHRCSPNY